MMLCSSFHSFFALQKESKQLKFKLLAHSQNFYIKMEFNVVLVIQGAYKLISPVKQRS